MSTRQQSGVPSRQLSPSPAHSHFLHPDQPGPSSILRRASSHSADSFGRIPSPRPPIQTGSRSSFTSKILSRQSSLKEKAPRGHEQMEQGAGFGDDGWKSPMSESSSAEVVETQAVRVLRDDQSGRWMINQYKVLREIGHGTHGRVRLGEELSEGSPGDDELSVGGPLYAIKIVDRNPKKKRLTGLGRQKGMKSGRDGAKMLNEAEIRKEIAIFKKVNHPNVVRMKEIIDDPESSKIYMIMEWCENGEIRWKEAEGSPALTVGETRKIFRDTLLGLEYLHHQGIIHRDIKPSNLLRAADNTVKISDFGCSHYSEALRAAAHQPGPDGDAYVDDIELAKTAGSPAFFAPEMCYSGLDTDMTQRSSSSPQNTPMTEVPSFTLRPPSLVTETRSSQSDPLVGSVASVPLRPTLSNDSAFSRRPPSARSHSSSATIQRKERLPITNAIDVWALGVTFYCLLFGKTPFDAANEYLLMQVIPVQAYVIPPFMGKDHMPSGTGGMAASEEARECLDLLSRLLEKDPAERITLDQAKKHAFTLRGIPDPASWLARTDPHTQTFVTVSSDEVAAVITKSTGFRDRFRKGIKHFSHKLQQLGSSSRTRSRSIGEADSPRDGDTVGQVHSAFGTPRSSKIIGLMPPTTNRDVSPMNSPLPPPPGLSRRFSLLGAKLLSSESHSPPHDSPVVSGQASPESGSDAPKRTPSVTSMQSTTRAFVVHRRPSAHLTPALTPSAMVPLVDDTPRSPRAVASSSSLDKIRAASDLSPNNSLRRQRSNENEPQNRQRSQSNASSISSKLIRLLRSGSQRARPRVTDKEMLATSDADEPGIAHSAASSSPADAIGRMSLDEVPRRSLDTSDLYASSALPVPSPERPGATWNWDPRLRYEPSQRRGSNLSEEFVRDEDEEEIDWNGAISDEEDYEMSTTLPPSAPNLTPSWRRSSREGLGLDMQAPFVSAVPTLDPIPDGSPSPTSSLAVPSRPAPINTTDSLQRTPSRASSRLSQSPYCANFPGERAKSPLGLADDGHNNSRPLALSRQTSASVLADDEEDGGLAISVGSSKRGRRSSTLGRRLPE